MVSAVFVIVVWAGVTLTGVDIVVVLGILMALKFIVAVLAVTESFDLLFGIVLLAVEPMD